MARNVSRAEWRGYDSSIDSVFRGASAPRLISPDSSRPLRSLSTSRERVRACGEKREQKPHEDYELRQHRRPKKPIPVCIRYGVLVPATLQKRLVVGGDSRVYTRD